MAERFYEIFLKRFPEAEKLFTKTSMREQYKNFIAAIIFCVDNAQDLEKGESYLKELGCRHADYGTKSEHYEVAGTCLLEALKEFSGDQWRPELELAWAEAWLSIKGNMQAGAG
jgi:hemoglobin-like flavoprotein